MIPLPTGVRVWIAAGHTDHAARDAEPGPSGAGGVEARPPGGRSLRVLKSSDEWFAYGRSGKKAEGQTNLPRSNRLAFDGMSAGCLPDLQ
jgi:hypothetical protein